MGDVTFYDPAVYDYGEGGSFRSRTSKGGAVTHARVQVRADAEREASWRARQIPAHALDTLVIARSVGVPAGGFRPLVDSDLHVSSPSVSGSGWSTHSSLRRAEMHDREMPVTDDILRFARFLIPSSTARPTRHRG